MRLILCTLFAALWLFQGIAAAQNEAATRIAILSGEGDRAPDEAVVALFEVALGQEENLTLLERAQVRKILVEQHLSASGLADSEAAIQMGAILSVDLFLFMERIPNTSPAVCRLQVIEAATGIVLASDIREEKTFSEDIAPSLKAVRLALAKRAVPVDQRRYVALLELRNEEPNRTLDGLASALSMLLVTDLSQQPDVIVLDREKLEKLTAEKTLSALDLKLRASSSLIVAGLRHAPDPGTLIVSLELRPPGANPGPKVSIEAPAGDTDQLRRRLLEAVTEKLGANGPTGAIYDPKTEAMSFAALVRPLALCGDAEQSTRAGEAAYALYPSRETRHAAWQGWYQYQFWCNTHNPEGVETQKKSLRAAIRRCTICLEKYQAEGVPASLYGGIMMCQQDYVPPQRMQNADLQRLHDELHAISQEVAAGQLRYLTAHYSDPAELGDMTGGTSIQREYWEVVSMKYSMNLAQPEMTDQNVAVTEKLLEAFLNPPGPTPPDCIEHYQVLIGLGIASTTEPQVKERYIALWREWRKSKHPFVRLIACKALTAAEDDPRNAAGELFETFLKEYPDDNPARTWQMDNAVFSGLMNTALNRVPLEEKIGFCRRLYEPWIKSRNVAKIYYWSGILTSQWLPALESLQQYTQADELAAELIKVLEAGDYSGTRFKSGAQNLVDALAQRRRAYAAKLGNVGADLWEDYEIYVGALNFTNIKTSLIADDRLYCVAVKEEKEGFTFSVGVWKIPGYAPEHPIESLFLPCKEYTPDSLTGIAWSGKCFYVASPLGLLEYAPGGKLRLISEEEGAPGTDLSALTWCDGKLYMGLGTRTYNKFGIAQYDPETGKGRIIASSVATEKQSVFDGVRYRIQSMLADPDGKSLWFSVRENDQHVGIWRYKPATGEFRQMTKESSWPEGGISWCGGNILYEIKEGLVLFNPGTEEKTWLAANYGARNKPLKINTDPSIVYPDKIFQPAWYDGEVLMARAENKALSLIAPGKPASPHKKLGSVVSLQPTSSGIFAVTEKGQAFRIKKK